MNKVVSNLTLLVFLVVAVGTDVTRTKISNRLIITGLLSGLVLRIIGEGGTGILVFIMNISIPVILLYLLFQMHALGAGDIKLFSVAGAFLTTEQLLQLMVTAFLAGAVQGIGKIMYQNFVLGEKYGKSTKIHFSIAILVAYLIQVWRWTFV